MCNKLSVTGAFAAVFLSAVDAVGELTIFVKNLQGVGGVEALDMSAGATVADLSNAYAKQRGGSSQYLIVFQGATLSSDALLADAGLSSEAFVNAMADDVFTQNPGIVL